MPPAIWPRTSSPPAWRANAPSSFRYAIGVSKPLSVYVDTHGTGQVDRERLGLALREVMDLSPRGIREHLQLSRPIYARTAAYGHFGRAPTEDGGFSWEKVDLVDSLKSAVGG